MHAFGGSTVVALMGDILKIHVHTDTPDAVFRYASRWGRVDSTKAEDMRVQHRRLARDNLLRSGRISRGKAWLAGMLDVKPILSFDSEGHVVPIERVRGRGNLEARALASLHQRLTPRPRKVRFGVAHADAPEAAERIHAALVREYQPQDCFVSLATGVLGTHVGPGAWGIFYQVEDGTATPAGQGGPQDE